MKFCLLENKKEAWYQRLCTIETIILKRRKKCLLYYQLCSIVSCSVWIQLCCQSCVFRCCFKPWHLSSFTLMGPHSDANNYTLHCNKIKSLLTYYRCFFLSFLTLCLLKTFLLLNTHQLLHHCTCIWHFLFYMAEHFYNQTGKTVNTRNISALLLCCKMKACWVWETKLHARILISFCGFVASWRDLIFAVIGRKYFKCSQLSRSHCKIWQRNCTITKRIKNNMFLMSSERGTKKSGLVMILGFKKHIF